MNKKEFRQPRMSNNKIICPYCDYSSEPWNYTTLDFPDKTFEVECLKCKKKFNITIDTHVTFFSSCKYNED